MRNEFRAVSEEGLGNLEAAEQLFKKVIQIYRSQHQTSKETRPECVTVGRYRNTFDWLCLLFCKDNIIFQKDCCVPCTKWSISYLPNSWFCHCCAFASLMRPCYGTLHLAAPVEREEATTAAKVQNAAVADRLDETDVLRKSR